jgi:SNF2 family DNA or RNA helicase
MISSGWRTAAESRKMPLPVWPVTYILTPMTLLGQWSDEIRKFAPKLKVAVIHSSGKAHPADIAAADVILCTPQSNHGPMQRRPLHRLIIDESHTIKLGTSIQRQVMDIWAHNVWLLTGTPVSTSVADLHAGAQILGQATSGVRLFEPYPSANAAFLTKLKKLCIRHTKTMRIGGEVALALPDSDVSTVWLTMSPLERRLYDKAVAHESMAIHKLSSGGASFTIEVALSRRRAACSNSYTKYRSGASKMDPSRSIYDSVSSSYTKADVESICNWTDIAPVHRMPHRPPADPTLHREYTADPAKCTKLAALRSDLLALRAKDASMHAVVFTHIMATHVSIVSMLRSSGFHVCEVSGTTVADKRHETIRDFQASGAARKKVAKVFVITMRTGAVGITLTAATRVYLMEPSFDPAMEVQAAGRIHRLGQDKDVLVKRFAFRDSLEANICTLHEAMKKPNSKVGVTDGVLPAAAVRILLGSANGKANAA